MDIMDIRGVTSGVNLITGAYIMDIMVMGFRDTISGVTCMDLMYFSDAISGASSGVNLMDITGMNISGVTCNFMDITRMDITRAER